MLGLAGATVSERTGCPV